MAATGDAWPAHNYDLSNSRATTNTQISAANVTTLKKKWSFTIPGTGVFGNYASTPIVYGGVVYFQDLNSNVYAVDQQTGKLKWKHIFKSPSIGPNGVSIGYGRLYGATESTAFALDPATGALIWKHRLTPSVHEGIDMAPQLYDNKVLLSTVPGSGVKHFYEPKSVGVVYSLDAATGKTAWSFNTVPTPEEGSLQRRRPLVSAGRRLDRRRLSGRRESGALAQLAQESRTARCGRAPTSTPTPSWRSMERPAS